MESNFLINTLLLDGDSTREKLDRLTKKSSSQIQCQKKIKEKMIGCTSISQINFQLKEFQKKPKKEKPKKKKNLNQKYEFFHQQQMENQKIKELMEESELRLQKLNQMEALQISTSTFQPSQFTETFIQPIRIHSTSYYWKMIIENAFKTQINKNNYKNFVLPLQYNSVQEYQDKWITVLLDEIQSKIFNLFSQKEFSNQKFFKCSLKKLQKKELIYYEVIFDNYVQNSLEFENFKNLLVERQILFQIQVYQKDIISIMDIDYQTRQLKTQNLIVQVCPKNESDIDNAKFLQIRRICPFTSESRELKALVSLNKIDQDLLKILLKPQNINQQLHVAQSNTCLNQSQQIALQHCLNNSKISLIQGPPGTGKSYLIIYLIKQLIKKKGTVLVCTPSNGALDNLIDRLNREVKIHNFIPSQQYSDIKIVRIGYGTDYSSTQVQKINLKNILQMYQRKSPQEIDHHYREIEQWIILSKEKSNFQEIKHYQEYQKFLSFAKMGNFKAIKESIILQSKVIFSTLNSSSYLIGQKKDIKYLIVDEATQASEFSNLVPFQLNPSKIILVGDPQQLPGTFMHKLSDKLNLSISLYQRMLNNNYQQIMLQTQYRMIPLLAKFPSDQFYQGKLDCATKVQSTNYTPKKIQEFFKENFQSKKIVFIDVDGVQKKSNNSFFNLEEIEIIIKYVKILKEKIQENIGIIAPYSCQVQKIRQQLEEQHIERGVEVNTIDGFQGREKDVILFSLVRSKQNDNSIGFLKDMRRMNVAITRSKYGLILVGNKQILKKNKKWKRLYKYIKKSGFKNQLILLQ